MLDLAVGREVPSWLRPLVEDRQAQSDCKTLKRARMLQKLSTEEAAFSSSAWVSAPQCVTVRGYGTQSRPAPQGTACCVHAWRYETQLARMSAPCGVKRG